MTVPCSASYLGAISRHAAREPGAVALVDGAGEVSFGQLYSDAVRVARVLRSYGVGAGDLVAVWLPNSREWIHTFLAASMLGAATLAVNTSFKSFEVSALLSRSRAKVLVMAASHRGRASDEILRSLEPACLTDLAAVLVAGGPVHHALATYLARPVGSLAGDAPAFEMAPLEELAALPGVVFTSSGTTGAPKMIVHNQFAVAGHVENVARAFQMTADDAVVMAPMPFCGVMGLETALSGLVVGRTVTTLPRFDAAGAVDQVERYRVTTVACSDQALRLMLEQASSGQLRSLRDVALAVFGGGDPRRLVSMARAAGFRAFQTYGSSEAHALLCYSPAGVSEEVLAVGGGFPVSDAYRIRATRDGQRVADGEHGALEIASPYLFAGYLHDTGVHRPLTEDGFFRTGDLGYTRADGSFAYLTRESDALRLSGFLVEPREIESFLESRPGVTAAQVVGVEHAGRTTVVAFVVGHEDIDADDLRTQCQSQLASFKVPAAVVQLSEFPTTPGPNGDKVRKFDLRTQAEAILAVRP